MSVSVIIPTYNRETYLRRCLSSLRQSAVVPLETIVVDDDPKYDPQKFRKEFPEIRLIVARRGALLSEKRNIGADASTSDYLFFVDDDNEVGQHAIGELLGGFKDKTIGVCVPVAYYLKSPGRVWSSTLNKGGRSPGFYDRSESRIYKPQETFGFHNAFMVSHRIFEEVGKFDAVGFPIHFSEIDLAYRLHVKNYKAVVMPNASVFHDPPPGNMHVDSRRSYYSVRNRIILARKYSGRKEKAKFLFVSLPIIVAYYLRHHTLYASAEKFRVLVNLLRGILAGFSFHLG